MENGVLLTVRDGFASPAYGSTASDVLPQIPGEKVTSTLQLSLQGHICKFVNWDVSSITPKTDILALTRASLDKLLDEPYFVMEKPDGIRMQLLILQTATYLIDGSFNFRKVEMYFPLRQDRIKAGPDGSAITVHNWTFLDGDIVLDKLIQNDIIGPRKGMTLPPSSAPESLAVSLNAIYPANKINYVLQTVLPRRAHPAYGLVFSSSISPYQLGLSKTSFTWTPPYRHTAFFQVSTEWRGRPPTPGFRLMISANGPHPNTQRRNLLLHDWLTLPPEVYDRARKDPRYIERIVECVYDPTWRTFVPSADKSSWENADPSISGQDGAGAATWRIGGWRFLRVRDDLQHPNDVLMVSSIRQAVADNITLDELEAMFSDDPIIASAASTKVRKIAVAHQEVLKRQSENEKSLAKRRKLADGTRGSGSSGVSKSTSGVGVTSEGLGVCYDFQNKGICRRGESCHFSHCACDTVCKCTPENNTFGQRPLNRRHDAVATSQGQQMGATSLEFISGGDSLLASPTNISTGLLSTQSSLKNLTVPDAHAPRVSSQQRRIISDVAGVFQQGIAGAFVESLQKHSAGGNNQGYIERFEHGVSTASDLDASQRHTEASPSTNSMVLMPSPSFSRQFRDPATSFASMSSATSFWKIGMLPSNLAEHLKAIDVRKWGALFPTRDVESMELLFYKGQRLLCDSAFAIDAGGKAFKNRERSFAKINKMKCLWFGKPQSAICANGIMATVPASGAIYPPPLKNKLLTYGVDRGDNMVAGKAVQQTLGPSTSRSRSTAKQQSRQAVLFIANSSGVTVTTSSAISLTTGTKPLSGFPSQPSPMGLSVSTPLTASISSGIGILQSTLH